VTEVTPPVVLSIGGSDSSGGSGLQADLRTFAAMGAYAATVVTAVVAKNTRAAADVLELTAPVVAGQLKAVLDDLPVAAVKTGMFAGADSIGEVLARAKTGALPNLVVDPVLLNEGIKSRRQIAMALERLLPYALVATPNREEASALLGWQVATPADMAQAARELVSGGPQYVVVTGGDLVVGTEALDAVWAAGEERYMTAPRISARNVLGSGAVFSAAIAARLAHGDAVVDALAYAKGLVGRAIQDATDWRIGTGPGPIDVCGWSAPAI
jgi:hydroxymethylpyrimidine kinase/phosphomethylpyrimidine kinase